MKYYNSYLKEIKKIMGKTGTTFTNELNAVGKILFKDKYKGTYASNKIPRLTSLHPYCILNLDSSDKAGSHWIALVKMKGNKYMFYDSFGRKHTKIMPSLKSLKSHIINSDLDSEQKIHEDDCGQRCMAWMMVFDRLGKDLAKFI